MVQTNGQQAHDPTLVETLKNLLRAGLELGVSEAARKVQELTRDVPPPSEPHRWEALLRDADLQAFIDTVRQDPSTILQVVKEVWSRGGPREKETAADALGTAIGRLVPHRALAVARELAIMARNAKEADLVGTKAIGPILDANPTMPERVKQMLQENQTWLRRAAITGVVFLVGRKRKYTGLALEMILLLADQYEKEIRDTVRWAVREVAKIDPKATAKSLVEWVRTNPSRDRVKIALGYVQAKGDSALVAAQKAVFTGLARFAEPPPARPAKRAGARRPSRAG